MNVVGGGMTKAISVGRIGSRSVRASKRMQRRSYVGAWTRETEVSYKECPTHVGVEAQGTEYRCAFDQAHISLTLEQEGRQFYRLFSPNQPVFPDLFHNLAGSVVLNTRIIGLMILRIYGGNNNVGIVFSTLHLMTN